jgi:hypothetical protein
MKKYILLNKYTPILEFLYEDEKIQKITGLFELEYAPIGIFDDYFDKRIVSLSLLNKWWKNRKIPASRNHLNATIMNLEANTNGKVDLNKLILLNHSLSLSDQYWTYDICKFGEFNKNISYKMWDKINYFDNSFSDDIGQLLIGSKSTIGKKKIDFKTPNATINGNLRKAWKIINGKRILLKSPGLYKQESYNEVIISKILKTLLKPNEFTKYKLYESESKGSVDKICGCKNFLTNNEELIPALYISNMITKVRNKNYKNFLEICKRLNIPNYEDSLNKMLTVDFIIANRDRHFNNFGVIRNVNTLKFKGFAPIFDNGLSLYANVYEYAKINEYNYESIPFRNKPIKQLELVNDLSWLKINKTNIINIIKQELNNSSLKPYKEKIDNICFSVNKNIQTVEQFAKRLN